ncbi:MAG: M3 family oligoendopeptidase [Flavobacteriales bacterium]|nr:M3 family oligoendopeptidase [Flavobacteriales bacterium]
MLANDLEIPVKKPRTFVSNELEINSWEALKPYFEDLKNRPVNSVGELEQWMLDRSELDAVLEEDMGWRYIRMSIDTTSKELADQFHFFVSEIHPKVAPYDDAFNRKLMDSPYLNELQEEGYETYLRRVRKEIEIYRDENVPLLSQLEAEQQKYGAIAAAMTVEVEGKELTLQQAAKYLKRTDRSMREQVYTQIVNRRAQDVDALNELYTDLIAKRDRVAHNAGFSNYRDYMFAAMGRFDYTPQDCFDFHEAIAKEVVPVLDEWQEEHRSKLGVDPLKPWDLDVDAEGKEPLQPFEEANELISKSVKCFNKINPYFGERLAIMQEMKHLDLASKTGKAPGGFNYPLYEIGVPFIYMNAVGTHQDLITMVHEGGHAIQSFLNIDLKLTAFKDLTSEVAELASMSMELISMDGWDEFYTNPEELKRAKVEQLHRALETLPWVATIDKFQHWVYENPTHTVAEREAKWNEIMDAFGSHVVDWSGYESARTNLWQKQLHLFEVPFYYIEYAMAQLGAIAVWRNYRQNPERAIQQYMDALSLGYTKTIGEIYETAGIEFNFSQAYVKELVDFVKAELAKL